MSEGLPLSGLVVVELGHSVSAPFGGVILAELGARVVKVEKPDGGDPARDWGPPYGADGAATMFQVMNRGKESIAVDLANKEERASLRAFILGHADIVIQNLRAGAVERYGLDGASLIAEKPSLIYCNLHAFGATGPLKDRPGYDPLMQAFGGIMSVTGEGVGRPPVRVGVSIIDMGTGMWSAIGILAAVVERNRSGRGGIVGTALYETAIAWMSVPLLAHLTDGKPRTPQGSGMGELVPYQAFATSDGYLMVAAGNDNLWRRLCGAIERPDLGAEERYRTNGSRVLHRAILLPQLEAIFKSDGMEAWAAKLEAAGVPNAPIHTVEQVVADAQARALGIFQPAPGSDVDYVALPVSFDGKRPPVGAVAPALGRDNEAVLGVSRGKQ